MSGKLDDGSPEHAKIKFWSNVCFANDKTNKHGVPANRKIA